MAPRCKRGQGADRCCRARGPRTSKRWQRKRLRPTARTPRHTATIRSRRYYERRNCDWRLVEAVARFRRVRELRGSGVLGATAAASAGGPIAASDGAAASTATSGVGVAGAASAASPSPSRSGASVASAAGGSIGASGDGAAATAAGGCREAGAVLPAARFCPVRGAAAIGRPAAAAVASSAGGSTGTSLGTAASIETDGSGPGGAVLPARRLRATRDLCAAAGLPVTLASSTARRIGSSLDAAVT